MKLWKLLILVVIAYSVTGCNSIEEPAILEDSELVRMHPAFGRVHNLLMPSPNEAGDIEPASKENCLKAYGLLMHLSDSLMTHIRSNKEAFYEYQLLKAAVANQLGAERIDDKAVRQAVSYFDSLGTRPLQQAHAHSLLGRAAYSKGLLAESAKENLMGLRILEEKGNVNLDYNHAFGLSYNRMALLLYSCGDFDCSIECLKKGAEYFMNENSCRIVHDNLITIGTEFFLKKVYDSAAYYYTKAADMEDNMHSSNDILSIDRRAANAFVAFHDGNKEEAYNTIYGLLSEASDEIDTIFFDYVLGNFYLDDSQYDSALYYLEPSFKHFLVSELEQYTKMITLCNKVGDTVKAEKYARRFASIRDEELNKLESKNETQNIYENYKAEQERIKLQHSVWHDIYLILLILGSVLLIAFHVLYIVHRKQRNEEFRHIQYAKTLLGRIRKSEDDIRIKDEQIQDLQKKLEENVAQDQEPKPVPFEERMQKLLEKPVCKEVLRKIENVSLKTTVSYTEFQLTKNQQVRLVKAVDEVFNRFSIEMLHLYPRLTRSDILYCCLFLLDLNEKQIAALVGTTYQNVWSRSSKMGKIFNSNLEIRYILQDILSDWKF